METATISLVGGFGTYEIFNISGTIVEVTYDNIDHWMESKAKSAVHFAHQECDVTATISINGESLGPLYAIGTGGGTDLTGFNLYYNSTENVDFKESELKCWQYPLLLLDGTYSELTCHRAIFILDKNTNYTYTVQWENGDSTSGQFTSPNGGRRKYVFLENPNEEDCVEEDTDDPGVPNCDNLSAAALQAYYDFITSWSAEDCENYRELIQALIDGNCPGYEELEDSNIDCSFFE